MTDQMIQSLQISCCVVIINFKHGIFISIWNVPFSQYPLQIAINAIGRRNSTQFNSHTNVGQCDINSETKAEIPHPHSSYNCSQAEYCNDLVNITIPHMWTSFLGTFYNYSKYFQFMGYSIPKFQIFEFYRMKGVLRKSRVRDITIRIVLSYLTVFSNVLQLFRPLEFLDLILLRRNSNNKE